jgi:hypothetical protein
MPIIASAAADRSKGSSGTELTPASHDLSTGSDAIVSAIFSATGVPRASAKIGEVVNLNPGRARFGAKQEGSIKCCSRGEFARTFASYGHCLFPRSLR